ncbi:uncharacterized protein LOC122672170 [Telopea speciosissima]|uniref:uncharacterized protein LOC122672170 n=1 Tax=Telopea speciosissima TaxID=54955 RepID=UPI001CC51E46|nr:uncharacterized protein LOC122672170 [Telopea speciosissima]
MEWRDIFGVGLLLRDLGLNRDPRLKSRHSIQQDHGSQLNSGLNRDSVHTGQLQRNPTTRSLSPLPDTNLSDSFKEAQSEKRRFSTPGPRRKEPDRKIPRKIFARDSHRTWASDSSSSSTSISDKLNSRWESSWTKYFDHGGGRVTAVETTAEFKVDLSQLFYGLKFAIGAHSRIYHGIYKDEPIAMKILSPPDDDENGAIAARLDKQFTREVTHLSHLHHQNVIKAAALRLEIRGGEWRKAYLQMDGEPWKQPMDREFSTFVEIRRVPFQSLMINGD